MPVNQLVVSRSGTRLTSPETDGPGGHQDVSGQNIDHRFDYAL